MHLYIFSAYIAINNIYIFIIESLWFRYIIDEQQWKHRNDILLKIKNRKNMYIDAFLMEQNLRKKILFQNFFRNTKFFNSEKIKRFYKKS